MPVESIPVADLLFDPRNPRLVTQNQSQRDTLRAIAKLQDGKLLVLADDIVTNGVDPTTNSIVMRQRDGRYLVLEGNRRLAAIRAMENPESVADAVSQSTLRGLRRLSARYLAAPIDEIPCLVVKDRDEPRHWIELRHAGEMGGAGLTRWSSNEIARYRQGGGGPVEIDTQALNMLEERGLITAERRSTVPVSTLRRMLSTPPIRMNLGLGLNQRTLTVEGNEAASMKALLYVVNQIADGKIKVQDVISKEKREAYAATMPKSIIVSSAKPAPTPVATKATKTVRGRAGASAPGVRDKLIPNDCLLDVTQTRVHQIEDELRGLSLASFPNAVSVLFRVFMELSADDYIETNNIKIPGGENAVLGAKLKEVTDHLVAAKKLNAQQAKPMRSAAQQNSWIGPSLTTMHQWVHNQYMHPAASDLRSYWDSLQPWFMAVWPQ